ncbi:MAG TPA: nucleotidyltransferase family protein [Thermoanaerobaculia bacterium]|nr:nucleotidyltransferase family protein [Thermoanaerobaculia bacterium]
MRVIAIVLAAGTSSRLGRPKQLVPFGGTTLLQHAIDVARGAGCDKTLVVTRNEVAGTLSDSIRFGVEAAGYARVLITLCDQPLITSEHLRALLAINAPIVATRYGNIVGAPAAFAPRFASELRALTGDRGARDIIDAHADEVVTVTFEDAAVDIDTEADVRNLKT